MSFLSRRFVFPMVTALGLVFIQPASASNILVFGDGFGTSAANSLEQSLIALGHTVVNHGAASPLTNTDFVGVDTAWHVGSSAAYINSGTTPSALHNFLFAGGGLHLTGENGGFAGSLNTALLDTLVNPLITDPNLIAGGTVIAPVTIATGLSASIADVLTAPNNVAGSSINAAATGELLGVEAGNAFALSGGSVVGAVFGPGDLIDPGARISILMDVNWLLGSGDIDVIENLQVFLEGGPTVVAMPEPGTALLLVSSGFLVIAYRRRRRS